jgi:hypothetical protein
MPGCAKPARHGRLPIDSRRPTPIEIKTPTAMPCLSIRGDHEKAGDVIKDVWPNVVMLGSNSIAARIREARIPLPPLLDRFTGDLHLLGDAGYSLLQRCHTAR